MYFIITDQQKIALPPFQNSQARIGEGGRGWVYRIGALPALGDGQWVVKIFKDPATEQTLAKLNAMINCPPARLYQTIAGVRYTLFTWVRYLLVDDSERVVGYVMPELDKNTLSLAPFIYPYEAKKLTDYQKSLNYRVQLCANICALMADLHAQHHAFIDFKETNIRLLPEPNSSEYGGFIVSFIDCDDYLIRSRTGQIFPCQVLSPEISSPEFQQHKDPTKLDEYHDRFALAIQLFKILNYGVHPFSFLAISDRIAKLDDDDYHINHFIKLGLYPYAKNPIKNKNINLTQPPTADNIDITTEIAPTRLSIHWAWDDATRTLFDKAFLSKNPSDRPTAKAWEQHFRQLLNTKQFVACEHFPDDVRHIHFANKPCAECFRLTGVMPTVDNVNNVENIEHVENVEQKPNNIQQDFAKKYAQKSTVKNLDNLENINIKPNASKSTQSKKSSFFPLILISIVVISFAIITTNKHNNAKKNIIQNNILVKNNLGSIKANLPKASQQLSQQIHQIEQNSTAFQRLNQSNGKMLYQNSLNLPPEFFDNVLKVAKQGENDLQELQSLANHHDVEAVKEFGLHAFRKADFGYFNKLPVNSNLASSLNDLAKYYYWQKNDAISALYLQAQAVKNQPTHNEYASNLAFYLTKNHFPFSEDFSLYALQTPRDKQKPINTYTLEMIGANAILNDEQNQAQGSLLAQYYLSDDKAKRCENMRRYPKNYPELVPIAKQVFEIIQADKANNPSIPKSCLAPFK